MNPLDKILSTIIAGVVLAVASVFLIKGMAAGPAPVGDALQVLGRWLHIAAGITWIGLV